MRSVGNLNFSVLILMISSLALLPNLAAGIGAEEDRPMPAEVAADIAELKMLLARAQRRRVRLLLENEISALASVSPSTDSAHKNSSEEAEDPLPHLEELEDWDEDVKLPPPRAQKESRGQGEKKGKLDQSSKKHKQKKKSATGEPAGRASMQRRTATHKGMDKDTDGVADEDEDAAVAKFIGNPSQWVEVWSPKVKVTLLPYGVAECSHVQGQLEQCNLEGCHSGRSYTASSTACVSYILKQAHTTWMRL
jgi:hypothetical protein